MRGLASPHPFLGANTAEPLVSGSLLGWVGEVLLVYVVVRFLFTCVLLVATMEDHSFFRRQACLQDTSWAGRFQRVWLFLRPFVLEWLRFPGEHSGDYVSVLLFVGLKRTSRFPRLWLFLRQFVLGWLRFPGVLSGYLCFVGIMVGMTRRTVFSDTVVDSGSGMCFAGFVGEDAFCAVVPLVVLRPKMLCILVGMDRKDS